MQGDFTHSLVLGKGSNFLQMQGQLPVFMRFFALNVQNVHFYAGDTGAIDF